MDELLRALAAGAGKPQAAKTEAPLGNLLAALLGGGRPTGEQSGGGDPLSGLLGALLGGGAQTPAEGAGDLNSLAEQTQVTPVIVQAVVALLVGQMTAPGATKAAGTNLAALLDQANSGGEIDEVALKASGLPEQLVKTTGLDLTAAIRVLQKLLPALAGLLNLPGQKPAAKPKPAARPTAGASSARPTAAAKPKPASSTAASSSAAKPKPTGSASPKPAAKPRPRKSDGLMEINLDEPLTEGQ